MHDISSGKYCYYSLGGDTLSSKRCRPSVKCKYPSVSLLVSRLRILNLFETPQIPLSFSPEVIVEDRAVVEIRGQLGGRSLTWVFPIVGTGEAPGGLRVFSIACPAKSSTREYFEVHAVCCTLKGVKRLGVSCDVYFTPLWCGCLSVVRGRWFLPLNQSEPFKKRVQLASYPDCFTPRLPFFPTAFDLALERVDYGSFHPLRRRWSSWAWRGFKKTRSSSSRWPCRRMPH